MPAARGTLWVFIPIFLNNTFSSAGTDQETWKNYRISKESTVGYGVMQIKFQMQSSFTFQAIFLTNLSQDHVRVYTYDSHVKIDTYTLTFLSIWYKIMTSMKNSAF